MSVTPRGSGFQAQVNHKGARYRRDFRTIGEAKLWEAQAKAALLDGRAPEMGAQAHARNGMPRTLKELIDHVYDTHWVGTESGEHQRANAMAVAVIVGPHTAIEKVTKLVLDRAKAKLLEGGNSPATVNRKLAAVSKCMTVALDLELIARKPRVEKFKETEGRVRRFTPDEEAAAVKFFEHIGHPELADYVLLSVDTGLRQSEMLSLTFRACSGDVIQLAGDDTKSGKNRTVPLTKRAKDIIKRRREDTMRIDYRVLGDLSVRSIHHYWNRLKETMELSNDANFTPHIMRHEFCSRLADRNLNAAIIQRLAGHASMVTTQRYIHVSGRSLVDAIGALEAA